MHVDKWGEVNIQVIQSMDTIFEVLRGFEDSLVYKQIKTLGGTLKNKFALYNKNYGRN